MSMLDILLTILFSSSFLHVYGEEKCPEGQIYDSCLGYNITCSYLDVSNDTLAWPTACFKGCKCKDNKYINQKGECVNKEECSNYENKDDEVVIMDDVKKCPRNAEYVQCSNICAEKNCATYGIRSVCRSLRCGIAKCQCKDGYVRSNGPDSDCVKPSLCKKIKKF